MDAALSAAIVAGATLGGVVIGWLLDRSGRGTDELRAAESAYLAAIDSLAMFLGGVKVDPSPGRVGRALDKAAEKVEEVIGPDVTHSVRYALNRSLTRRMEHLVDQFWSANSRLALIAPSEVLDAAHRANAVLGEWGENPGPQLMDEWTEVRPAVGRAFRQALDSRARRALRRALRPVRGEERALPAPEPQRELGTGFGTDLSASACT